MAFFYRWWREQSTATQAIVKNLVNNGQLEFINGGWTMHDEACVHFEDMVDQMTLGHQFLFNNFGIVPKIGWQLDPFGHSSTSAIIDYLIGFEGLFFARMDYQDEANRNNNKGLEMIWNPSASMPDISILTGMMHGGYCNPSGFMFEYGDDPIRDDPLLEDYDLPQKAAQLMQMVNAQASLMRHNDIMLSWGCDFMYQNAHVMYKNIEKLMNYINANQGTYNALLFYSTPSKYAEAIKAANPTLPTKSDDFMPYADGSHSYWSGYFTSRATLKGFVRYSSHILHGITAFYSSTQIQSNSIQTQIFNAQSANGVTTHHDSVTGTEKQHVADDYALNLNIANTIAYGLFTQVIGQVITPKTGPAFSYCPLLNESICPATTGLTSGLIPIVVYNPLAWANTDFVKLPVNVSIVNVFDSAGNAIPIQTFPAITAGQYQVVFPATVGALSFTTFFLQLGSSSAETERSYLRPAVAPFTLSNAHLSVNFDTNGNILSVTNKDIGSTLSLQQQYLYYISNTGDKVSGQASGAYIFRPASQTASNYSLGTPTVSIVNGSIVSEVRRYFQPDLAQVVRLYAGQDYIEIEDVIGPVDISDKLGKEIITKYTTNLNTQNTWYSDSNGIELLQRKLNYRPSWNFTVEEPVAGNYVPIDAITTINDPTQKLQLSVVVDRSRSGASLSNGELETMLFRRCLKDDSRGVGEPLNESTVVFTKEWLAFTNISSAASVYRPLAKKAYHPFILAFGPTTTVSQWKSQYKTDFAPLGITFPPNVQLLNFVPLGTGSYILRLHHIFQVNEDAVLSQPVTVDITNLLQNYAIISIEETQLTAVAPVARPDAIHMNAANGPITAVPVLLQPTEIRTFIVAFKAVTATNTKPTVHIV